MSIMKKPVARRKNLSNNEIENEREQLLLLRRQPNVDKKLIDMAMKSDADRMDVDEINEYLGRGTE